MPSERDAVFDDHFGSRRDKSPETSSAWEDYYKAQAERLAGQDVRATPMASTSKDGAAWEAYYRDQAKRLERDRREARANLPPKVGSARSVIAHEEPVQRPIPRAVPLFSNYYANKPAPIFRGLRYHIHKTTPSHIFGWLRSLLIWNGASLGCFRPDTVDVIILYTPTPALQKTVEGQDTGRTTQECRAGNVVNNGNQNIADNFAMPSIAIEPIGSAPLVSFDLNAGTVAGGIPDEAPWVYHRRNYEDDDMWAVPTTEPPAIASLSNTSGVFCRDQILPLTFHVLRSQEHRSTTQTITRLGGGVLTALDQATFIIAPIRGTREVEDSEMQDLVRDIDMGRAVLSVEWVEQCIDEDTLVAIDSFRVTLPGVELVQEELNELHEEESSAPAILSRLPSPSPPPVKPDVSAFFTPAPVPEAMRIRKRPRSNATPRASSIKPSILPTPRSSPAPMPGPSRRDRESSPPEITHIPSPDTFRKPAPSVEKRKRQIIDLTLSDDEEEEGVEQILPEQTPLPPSPPKAVVASPVKKAGKGPRWATEEDPVEVSPARQRGPTPSVFRLTPSASARRAL